MGIANLWKKLHDATMEEHFSSFRGKKAAIDGYIYLHRGVATLDPELVKKGEVDSFMESTLKFIELLKRHGIIPIVVLDGRKLPAKAGTDNDRKLKRDETNKKAEALIVEKKPEEARKLLQQAHELTKPMVKLFIQKLRKLCIDYVVSPYESDAQLYFLERIGLVDLIISADSDLVVFGSKTIIYKHDNSGSCRVFHRSKLAQCYPMFKGITDEQLRRICILSGCDYLKNLKDIGQANAAKIVKDWGKRTVEEAIERIPAITNRSFSPKQLSEYAAHFRLAENTFLFQVVFDPIQQCQRHLNQPPDFNDYSHAGKVEAKEFSVQFSLGNVDINAMKIDDKFVPNSGDFAKSTIIWKDYGNRPSSSKSTRLIDNLEEIVEAQKLLQEECNDSVSHDLSMPPNFYEGCESLSICTPKTSDFKKRSVLLKSIPEKLPVECDKEQNSGKISDSVNNVQDGMEASLNEQADNSRQPVILTKETLQSTNTLKEKGTAQVAIKEKPRLRIGLTRTFSKKRHNPSVAELLKKPKTT